MPTCSAPAELDREPLLIPYGFETWPAAGHGRTVPHVVVDTSGADPLRLNDGQFDFRGSTRVQDLTTTAERLDFLCDHIRSQCDLFAKYQRLFVDRYFAHVRDAVERARGALEASVARFEGLYRYHDWAFSAPRPLPRAHLPGLAHLHDDASALVRVDFAFWLGDALLAVNVTGEETRDRREAERRARLEAARVRVLELDHRLLSDDAGGLFQERFPALFCCFWRGEVLPSGPFRSTAFVEGDDIIERAHSRRGQSSSSRT